MTANNTFVCENWRKKLDEKEILEVSKLQMEQRKIIQKLYKDSKLNDYQIDKLENILHDYCQSVALETLLKQDILAIHDEYTELLDEMNAEDELAISEYELRQMIKDLIKEMLDNKSDDLG